MTEIANFAIYSRATQDVRSVIQLQPNTSEYTYVASAINLGLSMLETQQGREALTQLAFLFEDVGEADVQHFAGNRARARDAVDLFLRKTRASFPMVVIDHRLDDMNILGFHDRGPWVGGLGDFHPRDQAIYINGPRVNDMVSAATSEQTAVFRDFQFLFATTFFHEVGGHLLITYLGNGRPATPLALGGDLGYSTSPEEDDGESGRWLESHLLGGTLEWYKGQSQNMHHTGIPHLLDHQSQAWKIHPRTIDDVLGSRASFPFARVGNPVPSTGMQSMGRTSIYPLANDGQRRMMAQQASLARQLGRPAGYRVRVQDLRAVVNDPSIRLRAC